MRWEEKIGNLCSSVRVVNKAAKQVIHVIDRTSHGCEITKMKNARAKRANSFSLAIVQIRDVFVRPSSSWLHSLSQTREERCVKALLIFHCEKRFRNIKYYYFTKTRARHHYKHIMIHFAKAPFIWRKVVPGRRVTRLLELPWASQLFIHFLTKLGEPFTWETKSWLG